MMKGWKSSLILSNSKSYFEGTGYSLTVMKAAKKFSKNIDKVRKLVERKVTGETCGLSDSN